MPPPSSRSSSRSLPPSRGSSSRGGSPPGGGSSNAVATVVAIVVVLGIIGAVLMMSGKKPKPTPAPVVPPPAVVAPPTTAKGPAPKPYPEMPQPKFEEAAALVKTFEADGAKAKALYLDSQTAKRDGDDAMWQSNLKEAIVLANKINTKWNDFIATLPKDSTYDEEEVARHYFSKESGRVSELTGTILRASKTDEK